MHAPAGFLSELPPGRPSHAPRKAARNGRPQPPGLKQFGAGCDNAPLRPKGSVEATKTITAGATHVTLSHGYQHGTQRHRAGVPSLHLRLDERVAAWREPADTLAAVAIRCVLDGHPGTVAETSEPEPAARGALAGSDVAGLLTSCLIGTGRVPMRLGMVRVEGVR
jgi:hypothetical protein